MSSSRLRRKMEARVQQRLAVAQGGDENRDPHGRPVAKPRRGLAERGAERCATRSALGAEPAKPTNESVLEDTDDMEMTDCTGLGIIGTRTLSGDADNMEMTDCTGLGIIGTSQRSSAGLAHMAQPSTPLVDAGVSQRNANRRVNVGVDGETPLQLREVVMTPNEERRRRTWQPVGLSALDENSEDEVHNAGRTCTGEEIYEQEEDDVTLEIPQTKPIDFRHRDSLMISHRRRPAAKHSDDDDDEDAPSQQTTTCEPAGDTSSNQSIQEEIARLKAVETELRAQNEYERQRREDAEARLSALEEKMRERKNGCNDKSDGKDSARVQRLEQQIVNMAAELAKLDSIAAKGDYNARTTKVVHLKNNPVQKAQHLRLLDESRQQLLRENNGDVAASAEQVDELKKQLAALEKRHAVLKEVFHKQVDDFRQACLQLLGWEITMKADSKGNQLYKLTSLYAQAQEDFLVFKKPAKAEFGAFDLQATEYAETLTKELAELRLHQQQSSNPPIPNFLSQITHDLFHSKTVFTAYRALPLKE